MTKEQYDIFVKTLPEDGETSFYYKGIRYFLHDEKDGWNIDRVIEADKGNLSPKDEFVQLKVFPNIEALVSDKMFDGKCMSEIYSDMEYADY